MFKQMRVTDPLKRKVDPYKDFREIMLIELEQQFRFRHSLGKASRFFIGLAEGKLYASRCGHCQRVYMPPRPVCPDDLKVTHWWQLTGLGNLKTWTHCPKAPAYANLDSAYTLAYVQLDGTESLFLHQLRHAPDAKLEHGMRITTCFGRDVTRHPLEYMWFELAR